MRLKSLLVISFLLLTVVANAQTDDDPYQDYNRHMTTINDTFDRAVFKPIATVYQTVTPTPVREGINNFFDNLQELTTIFNDLLQGNGQAGARDTGRLLINSTVGVGGLFDIASYYGLQPHQQDFGLTLAKYGYNQSNYLVLPVLGPSTVRDAMAEVVDAAASVYPYVDDQYRYGLVGTRLVNERANLLRYNSVQQIAFDPYVAMRNAYLQNRQEKIMQTFKS